MSDYRDQTAGMATASATLEQQIMDPRFPKNEREWWASAELAALRAKIETQANDLAKLRASWADVEWWEISGMQEHMLEHGLIKKYSPVEPCGSECGCADTYGTLKDGTLDPEDAVVCYRRTALLTGKDD